MKTGNIIAPEGLTLEQAWDRLNKLNSIYVRLSTRRETQKIPQDYFKVKYPYGEKKTDVIRWIDAQTGGGFYLKDKIIAFHRKDEAESFKANFQKEKYDDYTNYKRTT